MGFKKSSISVSSDKNAGGNDNQSAIKLLTLFDTQCDEWQDYADAEAFLDFIRPPNEDTLRPNDTMVRCRELSFYEDMILICASNLYPTDDPDEEFYAFFLKHGDDVMMLDGSAEYIHEANSSGALKLTKDNVLDYIKFFMAFTADEETGEAFFIIEGAESEIISNASAYERSRVLKNYSGIRLISSADNKNFMAEARVLYCGGLFNVKMKVLASGEVVMTDDEHVGNV